LRVISGRGWPSFRGMGRVGRGFGGETGQKSRGGKDGGGKRA
jgi:hypothetical protein